MVLLEGSLLPSILDLIQSSRRPCARFTGGQMGVRCFQKPVQDTDLEATSVGQGKIRLACQLRAWTEKCHCHPRQVTGGDGPARLPSARPTLTPITARPECPAPSPTSPLRAAGAPEAGLPATFVTPVASRPRKGLSLLPLFYRADVYGAGLAGTKRSAGRRTRADRSITEGDVTAKPWTGQGGRERERGA